jgi:UDP-N-acetylglucosamine:LPS N-acetylglucosamine transferase
MAQTQRFLIVSASMGAGHDAVAGELAARLVAGGHRVERADVLGLLPPGVGSGLRGFYRSSVRYAPWVYDALYAAFFRPGAGRRPGSAPLAALAERPLLELVRARRSTAVVPVFHLAAQLTGRLRAAGRLRVPAAVLVTDFAVHRQWLHPGNDLHVCVSPGAAKAAGEATGRPALAPGPLVPAAFAASAPPGAPAWRRLLGASGHGRSPVLVSAGAWGVGGGLVDAARALAAAGHLPVVLCGHNTGLRRRLAAEPGVLALGWVRDLPGLMAAATALVDNAAGQTAVQAMAAGLPVVAHRPLPGHGAAGTRALSALGAAAYAPDRAALPGVLASVTTPGPARDALTGRARALFADDPAAVLAGALDAATP